MKIMVVTLFFLAGLIADTDAGSIRCPVFPFSPQYQTHTGNCFSNLFPPVISEDATSAEQRFVPGRPGGCGILLLVGRNGCCTFLPVSSHEARCLQFSGFTPPLRI